MNYGEPVHGEVSSANASGGVTVLLYPAGSTAARALASGEFLAVTDYAIILTVGGAFALVADADTAGERIVKGSVAALGGAVSNLSTPFACAEGITPVLIADAGQVDCVINGYITQV